MRVYCPDCDTLRRVPDDWVGRRLRCRDCGRVIRVGARNERREREDEPDDIDPDRHRTVTWIVACAILLVVGLVVGGGLATWYFLTTHPAAREEAPDDFGPPGEPPDRPPQFDQVPGDPD